MAGFVDRNQFSLIKSEFAYQADADAGRAERLYLQILRNRTAPAKGRTRQANPFPAFGWTEFAPPQGARNLRFHPGAVAIP